MMSYKTHTTMYRRTILTSFIAVLMAIQTFASPTGEKIISFYVSPSGSDNNQGNIKKPFATPDAARDAIRHLKEKGSLSSPVFVYFRGGTYELTKTFVLKPEDSGTPSCPITYCAFKDEVPVLSGGKQITGKWQRDNGNIWVCNIPEAAGGRWKFRQLFVNGGRMVRARIPDKDNYYRIDKVDVDLGRATMKYRPGDLMKFENLSEAEVVIFHSWNNSRLLVADINENERLITFTGRIGGPRLGAATERVANRYYIENIHEGLDKPGEWYLETKTGNLYIIPEGSVENAEIRAPVLEQIIRLEGNPEEGKYVQNIVITGLTFSDTDYHLAPEGYPTCGDVGDIYGKSTVDFHGTLNCSFTDNRIRNTGTYAFEVIGDGNVISGNEIFNAGAGGIITRSYGKEANQISFNHIHDCGLVFYSATGVNIDDGGGKIMNNLIHDISHTGIYGRHWASATQKQERRNQEQQLLIESNEIHHVGSKLNDCAGIFIRDSNIVIKNNLIHDVFSYYYLENLGQYNNCGVPGWGIYLGCETRYALVQNNIIYNTTEGLNLWHGSRYNTIENNIIVNSDFRSVRYSTSRTIEMPGNRFFRNIIYNSGPYTEYVNNQSDITKPSESDYNIFWCNGRKEPLIGMMTKSLNYSEWQDKGLEKHSVIADPMFRNPSGNDFTLFPDSPALSLGFKQIDISNVGLRGKKGL